MRPRLIFGRFYVLLRRLLGFCLRRIQGISVYRRIAKSLWFNIKIKKADQEDLRKVHAWFNPRSAEPPVSRNPSVTNFVAKKGKRVIGFVQLVRHSETKHAYAGYWLFSLKVRIFYRALGIGAQLSQAVIDMTRNEGAKELSLLVREDNQWAISLYTKLGFKRKVIPALKGQLEKESLSHGSKRVVMSLSL